MITDDQVRALTGRSIESFATIAIGTGHGAVGQTISVQLVQPIGGRSTIQAELLNTVAPSHHNLSVLRDGNGKWWAIGNEATANRETVIQNRRRRPEDPNPSLVTVLFQTSNMEYDAPNNEIEEVEGSKLWLMTNGRISQLATLQEVASPVSLNNAQPRRQYWLTWISDQRKVVQVGSIVNLEPGELYPSYQLTLFTWLVTQNDRIIRSDIQTHNSYRPYTGASTPRTPSPAVAYPSNWNALSPYLLPSYPTDANENQQSLPPIYRERGVLKKPSILPRIQDQGNEFVSVINPIAGGLSVVQLDAIATDRLEPPYWVSTPSDETYQGYFTEGFLTGGLLSEDAFKVLRAQSNPSYDMNARPSETNLPWKNARLARSVRLRVSATAAGVNETEVLTGDVGAGGVITNQQILDTEAAIADGKFLVNRLFYTRLGDSQNDEARDLGYYHVFMLRCVKAWLA